ncbi:MAG: MerR family transcriptional regulator [Bdellovibrio sp.]|nr:MerR family transcriptional regulator [Bdellovibrio sp.]
MLSIGQFAKSAHVSARTVRYYESIGLLPKSTRGENNYRFYDQKNLPLMNRIRDLQSLGFSLEDIKIVIHFSENELHARLHKRLLEIEQEVANLEDRKERIQKLLSVANKIKIGEVLTATERDLYMENIKEEVLAGLHTRYSEISETALAYLKRDEWLTAHPNVRDYLDGVKKCLEFAKKNNLKLGPARGSASASLSLYGLGVSGVDPIKHELIPERLSARRPFFHIDVEYSKGQEFVDFCKGINSKLPYGEIQAFKMPLLDIVQNVNKALDQEIDFDAIDDNSDLVLNPFRNQDFAKIFQFDFSPDALVMNFEKFVPEFLGLGKITEHFNGQKDFSFRDIINITALWRPYTKEIVERIELYRKAKATKPHDYGFLSERIKTYLEPNYGVIIYQEDIIRIIAEYTGWDFARSNALRLACSNHKITNHKEQIPDWSEFQRLAPESVVALVAEESKWVFCQPHAIAFAKFTKMTAVLKSLHQDLYYQEIARFEQAHGVCWDDIGIYWKGVSLHQS